MSVSAVAFVPSAPLLVPEVAAGSASLDDTIRSASVEAVRRASGGCDEVVVVAATDRAGAWDANAAADFSGFGLAPGRGGRPVGGDALPWPLGVGSWLVDAAGWTGQRRYVGLGDEGGPAALAVAEGAIAIVAVGDGSACRTEKAPGYLDPRAEPFDEAVAAALATGDLAGLAAVDPALGAELLCAGLRPWRCVTTALADRSVAQSKLLAHVAPYGVAYFAAVWLLDAATGRQGRQ